MNEGVGSTEAGDGRSFKQDARCIEYERDILGPETLLLVLRRPSTIVQVGMLQVSMRSKSDMLNKPPL